MGALQAYLRQAVRILNELRRKGQHSPITDLEGIEVEVAIHPSKRRSVVRLVRATRGRFSG